MMPIHHILSEARVVHKLADTVFRLEFVRNGYQFLGHVPGPLHQVLSDLDVGDEVRVEMTPYDLQKAKIVRKIPKLAK